MRKQLNRQKAHGKVRYNSTVTANSRIVNISTLKDLVIENCPPEAPLRLVLVGETDVLSAEAFLAKLPIWLKLCKLTLEDNVITEVALKHISGILLLVKSGGGPTPRTTMSKSNFPFSNSAQSARKLNALYKRAIDCHEH